MGEVVLQVSTIVLTILLGLMVGSFLNVVIYRLPNDMSLVKPASHCPKCGNKLHWYHNIPVFSYIFLRGRCAFCKEKISIRYPLIELTNMVLWFLCLLLFTNFIIPTNDMNWIRFVTSCIVCSTLLCIMMIDYDHMVMPDVLQAILLICGLVCLLENVTFENILLKVIGCLAAGGLFWLVAVIFKAIRGKEGLGMGDVELVACMGLFLGGYKVLFALILSCVIGGIILIIITKVRKESDKQFPFGVLLVPGFFISMFVGDYVVNLYLKLLGAA